MMSEQTLENTKRPIILALLLAFILSAFALVLVSPTKSNDWDYYWQITLGRDIVENKAIPTLDTYSWISEENGYVETAHSWAGSILVFLFSQLGASVECGAYLYTLVMRTIGLTLILYCSGKWFKDGFCSKIGNLLALVVVFFLTLGINHLPRPMSLGTILYIVTLYVLHDIYENENSKKWLLLPVISVLWANLHGGSIPIMFAFCGLFVVMACIPAFNFMNISQKVSFSFKKLKKLIAGTVASVAAAMINPYGYKLFVYFFSTNSDATKSGVSEWSAAPLNNLVILASLALLFVMLLFLSNKRQIDISYLFPAGCCFIMCAKYVRITQYLAPAMLMFACNYFNQVEISEEWLKDNIPWLYKTMNFIDEQMNRKWFNLTGSLVSVVAFFMAVILSISFGSKISEKLITYNMSDEMIEAIEELSPKRMYNSYNTGSLLIYNGFQSAIDSRADPFEEKVLSEIYGLQKINAGSAARVDEVLAEYNFDAFLISVNDLPLGVYLDASPDYELYYSDDNYKIFVPKT